MKKKSELFKKSPLTVIVFVVLIILTVTVVVAALMDPAKNKTVCVILNESTSSEWSLLKEGLKQAAIENSLDLFVLTTDRFSSSADLEKTVQEESENYDGLIVGLGAFTDPTSLTEKLPHGVPVVLLGGNAEAAERNKPTIAGVSVNDYEMGKALALKINEEYGAVNQTVSVGIITAGTNLEGDLQRLSGVRENLDSCFFLLWTLDSSKSSDTATALRTRDLPQVMVALDNTELEEAALYLNSNEVDAVALYGTGFSTDAVYSLDRKQISAMAVPDTYNIGFLSVEMIASYFNDGRKMQNQTADFKVITPETVFDEDNQVLLFPVSQ